MAQTKYHPSRYQDVNAAGLPVIGSLEFYQTGTSTKVTSYSDYTRNTVNANPLNADSNGRFGPVFFSPDTLRAGIKVTFYDGINGSSGTGSVVYTDDRYGYDELNWEDISALITQPVLGGILYPRTDAEITAGIGAYAPGNVAGDVVNPYYPPGHVERYGTNATPGTTNMADAMQAAADQSKEVGGATVTGEGNYSLSSTVNLRYGSVNMPRAAITISHSGIGVICGGWSQSGVSPRTSGNNLPQHIGTITRTVGTASTTVPDLRIIGAKGQNITVERAGWVQLYADSDSSATDAASSAYSLLEFKFIDTLEFKSNASTNGGSTQWLNENRIKLGRCKEFIMDGTYAHSNNVIDGGTFEDSTKAITFTQGYGNQMNNLRLENGADINFGESSFRNRIIQSWTSSDTDGLSEALHASTVTDDGIDNVAVKQISLDRKTNILAIASVDDIVLNNQVIQSGRSPSLAAVKGGSGSIVLETKMFRVYKNDILGFYTETMSTESPGYRLYAYFYDATGAAVTPVLSTQNTRPVTGNYYSPQLTTIGAGYVTSALVSTDELLQIHDNEIAWCKLQVRTVTSYDAREVARNIFLYVRRLSGSPTTARRNAHADVGIYSTGQHAVTAAPTQGYAPLGYTVYKTDGTGTYVCIKSVDTTLSAGAAGGQPVVVLSNVTGIANGDIVGIQNNDTSVTNWTDVSSFSGSNVTLSANLTGACASGNRAVFLRWSSEAYV